jgi:hypothetical protein
MQMIFSHKCSNKWPEVEVGCHRSFNRFLDQEDQGEEEAEEEAEEVVDLIYSIY